ncbi:hypothetical protein [Rossellomorea marisflavi]|uniref:hypothetical protein n=1 Tax=Rossellomorea marisflavi TaxID=189381 RepID=UPI00114E1EAF|nr:hypothetical protein [Rossellomorea marisflavi]
MDFKLLHSYTSQSAVQRRTADSYGKSGQGETLQACRSGSPHAPWKAAVRSETERTIPFFTPHKKGLRGRSSTTTLVHTTECSAAEDGRLPAGKRPSAAERNEPVTNYTNHYQRRQPPCSHSKSNQT